MATIKLKDTTKKEEIIYKAGQFFKDPIGCVHVLIRTEKDELGMAAFNSHDAWVRYGRDKLFHPSMATLTFLNKLYEENLTPINVTISED